jgi:hypothetical protein
MEYFYLNRSDKNTPSRDARLYHRVFPDGRMSDICLNIFILTNFIKREVTEQSFFAEWVAD